MAAVAPVLFPEMRKRGLNEGEMVALLAAAGAMAETIPPSLVLIAIGSVTGVSIAALFTGGLLPGVVLAIGLAILARQRTGAEDLRGVKRGVGARRSADVRDRAAGAAAAGADPRRGDRRRRDRDRGLDHRHRLRRAVRACSIYRKFDWRRLCPMLVETASLAGRDPVHHRLRPTAWPGR